MRISQIILALRTANTHFAAKIGGAIELGSVMDNTLVDDVAFVIPLDDQAEANDGDQSVNQRIKEKFGIVVAIKNDTNRQDKTGFAAYDLLDTIRDQLIGALVNFDIGYETTIEYYGGKLLDVNRAWVWFEFDFTFYSRIIADEGGIASVEYRDVDAREYPAQLPEFTRIYMDIVNGKLSPDLPYSGQMPAGTYINVNASMQVDTDDDPNPGAYDSGFATAFRILMENIIRR
jgi:hypothetical protein